MFDFPSTEPVKNRIARLRQFGENNRISLTRIDVEITKIPTRHHEWAENIVNHISRE